MTIPRKILLLRPRFLGDVILSSGIPQILRSAGKDVEVWYLVESPYAEALMHHPGVAGLLTLDPARKNNPFTLWKLGKEIRAHRFDAVLDLFGNPRTARMSFFSGAGIRVGFEGKGRSWAYNLIAKPSSDSFPSGRRRVIEAYLDQVRALGIQPSDSYQTEIYVSDEEKDQVRKIWGRAKMGAGERVAVFTPGASWPAKHWPLEKFIELAGSLEPEGLRPVFIFGPKEDELARGFEEKAGKNWLFIHRPSLRGLVSFIAGADLLVANDSGPMHIGPAVGTPTLGIFGPGEPEIWFPYGAPHRFAYHEVSCSHCGLERCPLMACMSDLSVKEVSRIALEMMKEPFVSKI